MRRRPRVPGEPEVSIVLPTYNERKALEILHPRLSGVLAEFSSEVVVVDDSSPDGTGEFVTSRDGAPYRLIERPGRLGLASAVLEGFRVARGRAIVVLDADGSHPPEVIPALVRPILEGRAEFVLASRKVAGGSAPGLVGWRRAVSFGGGLLARPLVHVLDPMSGFFALDRRILARAELAPIGYKIALEVLVRCRPRPVLEVPFTFGPRVAGESKLGSGQIREYLRHLGRLYAYRLLGARRASRTR